MNRPNISNPKAASMADLLSPRQLIAIRAIANANNMDAESECVEVFRCKPEELSRRSASALIGWLKAEGIERRAA